MGPNVPREKIDWSPRINYDACLGDRVCYEFCKNDVFVWDEEKQQPIVEHPLSCVLGCDTCAQLCPTEAITFPTKEQLRDTVRRLRLEMKKDEGGAATKPDRPEARTP